MTDTNHDRDSTELPASIFVRVLGGARVSILDVFIGNPEMDFDATDVADRANVDRATFYRHVDDLQAWGLVEQPREVGNSKLYQLDRESDAAQKLAAFEWELLEHLAEKERAGDVDDGDLPTSP